ncbi:MAG: hypothetical protein JWM93_1123 [Frankiales bacterium]|nr:hypothetical protein [Frankiales bacterium]
MAVLGLIIALVSGAFIASAWLGSTDPVSVSVFGNTMSTTVGRLAALGALAGLLFALGLTMLFGGIGRSNRRRRETKQVVVNTRTEAEELRLENERLARELESRDSTPAVSEPLVAGRVSDGQHANVTDDETTGQDRMVDSGALRADDGNPTSQLYVARHRDETGNPIAYPEEPTPVHDDALSRTRPASDAGRDLR